MKQYGAYCFDVLLCYLNECCAPEWSHGEEVCALFVSWKKGDTLRGCLGTFEPKPISVGLREYAIASATQDRRFPPVTLEELHLLEVGISFLSNFEDASHRYDWTPGIHGISIEFTHSTRTYRSTYLPEVAAEQGWDHDETMSSLIHKSGFRGDITTKLLDEIKCTRYQSKKVTLSYPEYLGRNE